MPDNLEDREHKRKLRRSLSVFSVIIILYAASGAEIDGANFMLGSVKVCRTWVLELAAVLIWGYYWLRVKILEGQKEKPWHSVWMKCKHLALQHPFLKPEIDSVAQTISSKVTRTLSMRLFRKPQVKITERPPSGRSAASKTVAVPRFKAWYSVLAEFARYLRTEEVFWDRPLPHILAGTAALAVVINFFT